MAGPELSARLRAAADPGAQAFAVLVERHYAARFGGVEVPTEELDRLAHEVARPMQQMTINREVEEAG